MKMQRGRRPRRKVCSFCVDKAESIDYKDVAKLHKFVIFPVAALNISAN